MAKYLVKQNTVEQFAAFADKSGLKRRNLMIKRSHKLLERYINSRIIYNMMNEEAWLKYLNADDPAIIETLRVFHANKAFPKAPAKAAKKKTAVLLGRGYGLARGKRLLA